MAVHLASVSGWCKGGGCGVTTLGHGRRGLRPPQADRGVKDNAGEQVHPMWFRDYGRRVSTRTVTEPEFLFSQKQVNLTQGKFETATASNRGGVWFRGIFSFNLLTAPL